MKASKQRKLKIFVDLKTEFSNNQRYGKIADFLYLLEIHGISMRFLSFHFGGFQKPSEIEDFWGLKNLGGFSR